MKVLYGSDGLVEEFVGRFIPGEGRGFGNCRAIGILDNQNSLVAGVVYHNYCPESDVVELSAGSYDARWMTGQVLQRIFDIPFLEMGCQMIVQRVSENNKRHIRQLRRLGYDEYIIPRLRGRKEAEIIFTLTAEKWAMSPFNRCANGVSYGKEKSPKSA